MTDNTGTLRQIYNDTAVDAQRTHLAKGAASELMVHLSHAPDELLEELTMAVWVEQWERRNPAPPEGEVF